MADILGAVFRRFASRSSDLAFPSLIEGNTVVLGEQKISRSVLFLSAVTAATELAIKVLYFTQAPFESLPVSLRASVPGLKLESLKNVKFVYVRSLEDLLEDMASLHTLPSPPALIVVEALDGFLQGCVGAVPPQDDLSPVARAAALLHDTAAFLTHVLQERGNAQGLCRILVSCQPERDGARDGEAQAELLLSVLDRYLQVRCTLEELAGQDQWSVYLSFTHPSAGLQGQQWLMGRQTGGALEFRPDGTAGMTNKWDDR